MSRRRAPRRPQPTTDRRTADERLEALIREKNPDRGARMLERVRMDLDAQPEPGPWLAAARTLNERLIISDDALYYFAELFTECLVFAAARENADMLRASDAMEAIERSRGLREGDHWREGEAPDEWRTLNDEWERIAGSTVVAALRELGHSDLADAYEQDRAAFERRSEQGRVDLWGNDEDDDFDD